MKNHIKYLQILTLDLQLLQKSGATSLIQKNIFQFIFLKKCFRFFVFILRKKIYQILKAFFISLKYMLIFTQSKKHLYMHLFGKKKSFLLRLLIKISTNLLQYFFSTKPTHVFHLQGNFYFVHDHTVAFFSFFFGQVLISFTSPFL